jgi:hypothetical protein
MGKRPDWRRVWDFIRSHPGCRFLDIAQALTIAEVRGRIVDAKRQGAKIECRKEGKAWRYYEVETSRHGQQSDTLPASVGSVANGGGGTASESATHPHDSTNSLAASFGGDGQMGLGF